MRVLVRPLAARISYGWVILAAVSVTELVSWGILCYFAAGPKPAPVLYSERMTTGVMLGPP